MNNQFDQYLKDLNDEIMALKSAQLKSAGIIGTADYPLHANFTISEVDYGLFSTQAMYITATSLDGESFLSELLFTGNWDGRGYAHSKIFEDKGVTQWCVAMTVPRGDDYERYYGPNYDQRLPFDVSLDMVVRTTSAVEITTSMGENPYTQAW